MTHLLCQIKNKSFYITCSLYTIIIASRVQPFYQTSRMSYTIICNSIQRPINILRQTNGRIHSWMKFEIVTRLYKPLGRKP